MKPLLAILIALLICSSTTQGSVGPAHFYGAWESKTEGGSTIVKIYTPTYFIVSEYRGEQFMMAAGGTWVLVGSGITETYEFHSAKPEVIGNSSILTYSDHEAVPWVAEQNGQEMSWTRIDEGKSELAGAWRITNRMRNGEMSAMTMGSRKTFKILSGSRFQWAAYNVETKQFSGTGGGTYKLQDGKYTEHIEFFSRDASKLGRSLEFAYNIENNKWHHSGFSSKGDPISEIWTNQDK